MSRNVNEEQNVNYDLSKQTQRSHSHWLGIHVSLSWTETTKFHKSYILQEMMQAEEK